MSTLTIGNPNLDPWDQEEDAINFANLTRDLLEHEQLLSCITLLKDYLIQNRTKMSASALLEIRKEIELTSQTVKAAKPGYYEKGVATGLDAILALI